MTFRSVRNFSAWIRLVPKQRASGGKDKLGSISKQGDRYLRSLFAAGALAVIRYAKIHGTQHRPWLTALLARRPTKVAAIALANKIARMAWGPGLGSKKRGGGGYRCSYVSLQLIFRNGPVEGLIAALYAVLELSIPLRKLSKYFIWTRRSVQRPNALIEAHHVPGAEAMPGRYMFVQLTDCGAFSCTAQIAEAKRCTPVLRPPPCRFPRYES